MNTEKQGNDCHHDQWRHAIGDRFSMNEFTTEIKDDQQTDQVDEMPPRHHQGLAADLAGQFAESDERAGEGDRTDQDADVDFHFVDDLFSAFEGNRWVHVTGETNQARCQTNKAVHQRDQFRHLRHLHLFGGIQTDRSANHHGADDPGNTRSADTDTENRGQHSNSHADNPVHIAPACCFLIGQAAQTKNEKNGCSEVGDH